MSTVSGPSENSSNTDVWQFELIYRVNRFHGLIEIYKKHPRNVLLITKARRNRFYMDMAPATSMDATRRRIYVVDDDRIIRRALSLSLAKAGFAVRPFVSGVDFVDELDTLAPGGVLLDLRMPDMDGFAVLKKLQGRFLEFPTIVMTGHGDVVIAVSAMKAGASDFIAKPFADADLLEKLEETFASQRVDIPVAVMRSQASARLERLTPREFDVLRGLVGGLQNKSIAHRLALSSRTVEMHRASLMAKLETGALSDVLKIAFSANVEPLSTERVS